jgi:hypothetical protein
MKARAMVITFALMSIVLLAGCSSGSSGGTPPREDPPPVTELTWDQGNWDELDWQ